MEGIRKEFGIRKELESREDGAQEELGRMWPGSEEGLEGASARTA